MKYVAIGIAVNMLYEQIHFEFDHYVELFNVLNAAINDDSPNAVVFPTFQYRGLRSKKDAEKTGSEVEWAK